MSTWITPVTDRTSGAICTVTDINRIAGNLDYLATEMTTHGLYSGSTISKTAYTTNDYVTVSDWANILEVLNDLITSTNIEAEAGADDSTTFTNFNNVESLTLAVYEWYQQILTQANNNHYAGDGNYAVDGIGSIYAGGILI